MESLQTRLKQLADPGYRAFQSPLIPTVASERVLGVRAPQLRALAKELAGSPQAEAFLEELPHRYYDEDNLHAFLLGQEWDFARCIARVNAFLPYVDNWATCDSLRPPCFAAHRAALLAQIPAWLQAAHPYTVRFGIEMLMVHFLEEDFHPDYPAWVAGIASEEYYVNMMIAWYFATALAKQYDAVLPYLENRVLSPWIHNKTIQKAVESYRISPDRKQYLKSLRCRRGNDRYAPGKAKEMP